jgi:hypothetical protein
VRGTIGAGVLTDTNGQALAAHAYGAASRARRAHRPLSLSSADSESGIVPSSLFEVKDLRHAWFVPLCSEMRMHRSVPRTHTSTARGGRMEPRPRGYWTRVLEGGCCTRAVSVPGVLGGDSRADGNRVRWGVVRARAAAGASDTVLER